MTNADLEAIRTAVNEVCAAYEEPDSPEALACAFHQLIRVRDYVLPRCKTSGRIAYKKQKTLVSIFVPTPSPSSRHARPYRKQA